MRPALRIAWRDALRHRARSVMVLVMIALPVLAVTAAAVVIVTSQVSGAESADRRLGTVAAARVTSNPDTRMAQTADPDRGVMDSGDTRTPAPLTAVEGVLGARPALEYHEGSARVLTAHGVAEVPTVQIDLGSRLATGLTRLDSGRLPRTADEVVVSPALRDRGVGDRLRLGDGGASLRVVGVATSTTYRSAEQVWGTAGVLAETDGAAPAADAGTTWLVGGSAVTWTQVRRLNDLGVTVLSREVLHHPPSADRIDPRLGGGSGGLDSATVAVVALVVVMALLEVVLLAGPAFAVGARRQARTLALIAACGGTPRQARRVILAGGVVLGAIAAAAGVVLGLAAALVALPVAQHLSDTWFGPFQVPWLPVAGIAAFGLLSAFLAAVVPAWLASRQDVVAVLAGRRGDPRPSARSPLLGVLLLAAGVGGSVLGARGSGGELLIAVSALVSVVGMIFLVPVAVAALARAGRRLPLPLRYAVRDAARHRTRTVPAVAAVAATVAGVVALGIGNASDAAQARATYSPQLPMGDAVVTLQDAPPGSTGRLTAVVRRLLAQADVTPVQGIDGGSGSGYRDVSFVVPGQAEGSLPQAWSSSLGASVLVADRPPGALTGLTSAQRARVSAVLARGGAVVLTSVPGELPPGASASGGDPGDSRRVRITSTRYDAQGDVVGTARSVVVPAYYLRWSRPESPAAAVVAPAVAAALGAPVATVGLSVTGASVSGATEKDVREAVAAIAPQSSFYVERGYQPDPGQRLVLVVLGALGAVLMLGGTLTATFLALSDARPDLATLSAVGAAPRTRRGVAASYAVVIGLVGAVLGAAVGFVPGIAVSFPLTANGWNAGSPGFASHYLDVPWTLVVVLVVALPLLTAAVVGLTARSRLPLVARLD